MRLSHTRLISSLSGGLLAVFVGTAALMPSAQAEPGGCLKYGAAGAVGGHLVHHHAVIGGVGGCAAGMWRRHEYRKHLNEKAAAYDAEHAPVAYDAEHAPVNTPR